MEKYKIRNMETVYGTLGNGSILVQSFQAESYRTAARRATPWSSGALCERVVVPPVPRGGAGVGDIHISNTSSDGLGTYGMARDVVWKKRKKKWPAPTIGLWDRSFGLKGGNSDGDDDTEKLAEYSDS